MPHVPSLGWTEDALAAGAKDAGVSAAAHGQMSRGAVDLVAFVADQCADELRDEIDARSRRAPPAPTARALTPLPPAGARVGARGDGRVARAAGAGRRRAARSPARRSKIRIFGKGKEESPVLSPSRRLRLSAPYGEHRAQAMGLMATPAGDEFPPAIAAVPALARLADELARATLVEGEPIDERRWLLRRSAAASTYALVEIRALTDTSPDLADSAAFGAGLLDHFGDALETPEKLKEGLRGGARAAASLGGAALNVLPGAAVGALPQMLAILAARTAGGLEVTTPASATPLFSFFLRETGRPPTQGLAEKALEKLLDQLPPSPVPDPPRAPAAAPLAEAPAADAKPAEAAAAPGA